MNENGDMSNEEYREHIATLMSTGRLKRLVMCIFTRKKEQTKSFIVPPYKPMEPKDPMDWKLTKNSKPWWSDQYCPNCKASTRHAERMTELCNSCGFHGNMRNYRANRRMWDGTKWVVQRKYGNGTDDYTLGT